MRRLNAAPPYRSRTFGCNFQHSPCYMGMKLNSIDIQNLHGKAGFYLYSNIGKYALGSWGASGARSGRHRLNGEGTLGGSFPSL
jgi:hypothetical protein